MTPLVLIVRIVIEAILELKHVRSVGGGLAIRLLLTMTALDRLAADKSGPVL